RPAQRQSYTEPGAYKEPSDPYYVPLRTQSVRHPTAVHQDQPVELYDSYPSARGSYDDPRDSRAVERKRHSERYKDTGVERRGFGVRSSSEERYGPRGSDESFGVRPPYLDEPVVQEPQLRDYRGPLDPRDVSRETSRETSRDDARREQERADREFAKQLDRQERDLERERETRDVEPKRRERDRDHERERDYERDRDRDRDRDYRDKDRSRDYGRPEKSPRDSGDSLSGVVPVAGLGAAAYGAGEAYIKNKEKERNRERERERPPTPPDTDLGDVNKRRRRQEDRDRDRDRDRALSDDDERERGKRDRKRDLNEGAFVPQRDSRKPEAAVESFAPQ
ncbi:hypothetical protein LTR28_002293, partial [Elasticomyces elasticus]